MLQVKGFGNREWTERFVRNSHEFAAMARRIGENALALSFEEQAERAVAILEREEAGLRAV